VLHEDIMTGRNRSIDGDRPGSTEFVRANRCRGSGFTVARISRRFRRVLRSRHLREAVTLLIVSVASTTTTEGFGVAVTREDTTWRCALLAPELLDDLDGVITGLRRVATTGPVFALLAVDDEFFVVVRPIPGGAALLLSDATAGLDYDIAADVLDLLQVQVPEDDDVDDDPWPEGDLTLLADLGVSEQEMQLIVDNGDLYPDEQLAMIARACGFGDAFAAVLEKV
jgi:putative tRNA adenosine deaminase-associated protein